MIIETAQRTRQTSEYYFSVKLAEVRKLVAEGHDVINLGIGNPDMMPSEQTLTALAEAALKPQAHGYQPYVGTVSFRNAIAEYYQRTYGVTLNPSSEILPLIGSKEGITHISLTFLDPGDEVLVPELGYPAYRAAGVYYFFYYLRVQQQRVYRAVGESAFATQNHLVEFVYRPFSCTRPVVFVWGRYSTAYLPSKSIGYSDVRRRHFSQCDFCGHRYAGCGKNP